MTERESGEADRGDEAIQNASLAMQMLEEEFGHNEQQINFMENFIERKYGEISDLQGFLVAELQAIENSKAKNRKIEKILVASTLPALAESKQLLKIVKTFLQPLCLTASNFVEAVGEKARALLLEKQAINAKQKEEIAGLKRTIEELRKECQQARRSEVGQECQEREKPREEVKLEKKSPNRAYMGDEQRFSKISRLIDADNRSSKTSIKGNSTLKVREEREDSVSVVSKTGSKMSKYEQCYNNILESKKIIQYRCERMPMSSLTHENTLSPTKSIKKIGEEVKRTIKEENNSRLGERKEYIKQKIEKIKIKAECRQFKNQSPFNEKMRW